MSRGVGITHSNLMLSVFGPIFDTPFGTAGDLMLVPDRSTWCEIPVPDALPVTLLLGDFLSTDGQPWDCCPRSFLRRAVTSLENEFGLTLHAAFEQELVYTGVEARPGAPYSLDALRRQGPFGGMLLAELRRAGIAPDSFLAEYGPRQYEVTVGPKPALRAADEAVLVREYARAVAALLGHRAVLAPMIEATGVGSGTHVHWSLRDKTDAPVTYDPGRPHGLSEPAEHFTAGLLHHLPALAAITAPSAVSYYRLRPGRWAPTLSDLGVQDRGAAVRVCPTYATAAERIADQFNVEFRVADAAASPYLTLGALIFAGLDGLRQRRTLDQHQAAPLPASLSEALTALAASQTAAAWFGPAFFDVYLRFKRGELKALEGLDEAAVCERYAAIY
jgi:glutamine synthetase